MSIDLEKIVKAAEAAEEILRLARAGDFIGVGKRAAELGLEFVPVAELKAHLDDAAIARAEAVANAVEDAVYGPETSKDDAGTPTPPAPPPNPWP